MTTPSKQEIIRNYDKYAHWYDFVERFPELLGLNRVRKKLFREASGNVLEVAAGTGNNLRHYPKDCKITLIDLSRGMLKRALQKAGKHKLHVSIQEMDAERLGFSDNTFDTVVDSLSLCTLKEPVEALKEMSRVCKPSGRILLLEHGRSSNERVGRWQDKRADKHAKRLGCIWNRNILKFVEEAGLEFISRKRYFFGIFHAIKVKPGQV
ncbi:MAG: methyltransferase domain-containing protein [Acidobacteria bacterium]|nr:methyltransferase domain-containing protein [Acidobacteriota bacterium]MCZ6769283.1 methyltransferase domain-containing protein [Acidobacteriota bacterium]MCZ6879310.1 methyltransferase domain-containing protein [Acidobacteriota bacterium]